MDFSPSPGTHSTRLFVRSHICIIFPRTCGCFEEELAEDWLTSSHSGEETAFGEESFRDGRLSGAGLAYLPPHYRTARHTWGWGVSALN